METYTTTNFDTADWITQWVDQVLSANGIEKLRVLVPLETIFLGSYQKLGTYSSFKPLNKNEKTVPLTIKHIIHSLCATHRKEAKLCNAGKDTMFPFPNFSINMIEKN